MLRRLLTLLIAFFALSLSAQFGNPISWDFTFKQVEGDEYNLIATSYAEDGFMIYSQFTPEGGPIPTVFTWEPGDHYELIGRTEEKGHLKSGMDDMFGIDVEKFLADKPVTWTQRVKVKNYDTPIEMMVEWMCCDDEQCLPTTDEIFSFVLPGPVASTPTVEDTEVPETVESTTTTEPIKSSENKGGVSTSTASKPSSAPEAAPPTPKKEQGESKPDQESKEATLEVETPATKDLPAVATYKVNGPAPSEYAPVSWDLKADDFGNGSYRIYMTGTMLPEWTTYSKDVDPEVGPIPTTFVIRDNAEAKTVGAVTESSATLVKKFDKAWDTIVAKIDGGTVVYSQLVEVPAGSKISGYLEYQTCDGEMCLPPTEVPFSLDATGSKPVLMLDGLTAKDAPISSAPAPGGMTSALPNELGISVPFNSEPVGDCSEGAKETAGKSLWTIFGLGLIGGLFAMLMPCIFPMIPLTVSFFTKSGGSRGEGIRKAGLYGFFIFLIYVLLSVPFHLLDGLDPSILNNIASSVTLNVIFFVVFIFFAGSFFGFYELTLPESWTSRASKAEGTGGIVGIFFMALTLALVSFSCTGPILGSLLVEAVSGGAWPLTAGMAGFGVALGLPFALFAAFPGFLNNMPKSGGWLNSVKVVLGFVEVALAFKFLSTADLVGNWDLLRIEPFLIVWILCALGIAAYLLGFISFPLDSKNRKKSPLGILLAVGALVLTGYLAIGLTPDGDTGTYTGRKLMSGIAPPVCYNYLLPCDESKNITPFKDLEEGLAYARKVNKPVMLDFTGYSCVNCRRMEEHVWTEEKIKRYLTDEYVIISLYVDERTALPKEQQIEVDRMDGSGRTRLINTVGKKWQYFEQSVYAKLSQPYYVLVSPDGATLNPPVAYTADVDTYEDFLECGLATYQKLVGSK
jgi:thiol:disulfide interchange protein DsbD